MHFNSPSLAELHTFVALVELGSFTRAAQRLHVTQGAVSRAIQRLEATLGLSLFERSTVGVQPTPFAQAYYETIQPALVVLEEAVPVKTRVAGVQELRVSAIASLNMRWLVPRLGGFHVMHPWCKIIFKPSWAGDDMKRTDVDLWIQTRETSTSRWPRHLRTNYIIGREIVPICHPSVASRIQDPQDLLRFPLLYHHDYPGNWPLWLQQHGVTTRDLQLAVGFDMAAGLIEAVAGNLGVAVVQQCLLERELTVGRLSMPLPSPVSTGRGYYLCIARSAAETPGLVAFRDWVLDPARRAPVFDLQPPPA
jgi:LysR family transcriptional regulator, glycine cleavage system transcriptional activator